MTTFVSPQGALDISKWTRAIAFLGALVIVSRVAKLVKCVGFSLTIFISVGFGAPLTWSASPSQGDELSVQECLDIIGKTFMLPIAAPSWAWKLPFEGMQRTRRAYDTMGVFVRSQVNTIRETMRSDLANGDMKPGKDLFSLLIHASEEAGGKRGLSDDELIGDVFAFLFAGHDTTAHALAATLAFLAPDFDIQDELVSQVREVTEGRADDTLASVYVPQVTVWYESGKRESSAV